MGRALRAMQTIRSNWHPLEWLRSRRVFWAWACALDVPVWAKVYGVEWKMRLRLLRNATYLVNPRSPEPEVLALCRALARLYRPRTFWDIGACLGFYGLVFKTLDASIEVLMFEPDPLNVSLISQTVNRVGLSGVSVFPWALSNVDAEALFAPDEITGARGSLQGPAEAGRGGLLTVRTATIDTMACRVKKPVDVMKIDVEGHEEAVLEGGCKTLARDLPVVIFECFHQDHPMSRRLEALDYSILGPDTIGASRHGGGNFVALPAKHAACLEQLVQLWRVEYEALGV